MTAEAFTSKNRLESFAARFVWVICVIIFMLLCVTSLIYTRYYIADYSSEMPYTKIDMSPVTLIAALLTAVTALLIGYALTRNETFADRNLRILLFAVLAWTFAVSLFWVLNAHSYPISDQYKVYISAQSFLEGDYSRLEYGGYLYTYPSQLGLVAYESVILGIFGLENYTAIQIINVLWAVLAVYAGYRLTGLLTDSRLSRALCLLLFACCFPLFVYCSFVYNDVSAAALSVTAVWQVLSFIKTGRFRSAAAAALTLCAAVTLRNNALIIMTAILCVLIVKAAAGKNLRFLAAAALILVLSLAGPKAVSAYYESVSGIEVSDGMPSILWIAMGMQESDKDAGWYNRYSLDVYEDQCAYDSDEAYEVGLTEVKDRLNYFLGHPLYAADFYARKFTSQWNDPTYCCFVMTYVDDGTVGRTAAGESLYTGFAHKILENIMDSHQLLIYASVLFVLILARKNDLPLEWYLPLICVIGGVLFHMIWEAKSRYILPYFIMMIPPAACALKEAGARLLLSVRSHRKKGTGYFPEN